MYCLSSIFPQRLSTVPRTFRIFNAHSTKVWKYDVEQMLALSCISTPFGFPCGMKECQN